MAGEVSQNIRMIIKLTKYLFSFYGH